MTATPSARAPRAALAVALLLGPLPAAAQQVTVTIDPQMAQQLGLDAGAIEADLGAAVADEIKTDAIDTFVGQMADANLLSTKGMGVDYASNPQHFVVGGSIGTAVNGTGVQLGKGGDGLPSGGFAFQGAAMAGLNLGAFAGDDSFFRRIVVYGNGLAANTQGRPFTGRIENLGAHLQFQLARPKAGAAVEWGGIAFTTGYEWSRYSMELTEPLPVEADPVRWDASGDLTISSEASSTPFELSTNLRVLVATVFVGVASDVNRGAVASTTIALGGDITTQQQGETYTIGTAAVQAGVTAPGAAMLPRAFGGVQINILPVKLYGHVNIATDPLFERMGFGAHTGVRVAL
jgi:hypothetical protein